MKLLPILLAAAAAAAGGAAPAWAADRVVLSAGHVDAVAPALVGGGLALQVDDGTTRDPDDVLFHVKPEARRPGTDTWILPRIQDPVLLWAGWSSDRIPAGSFRDDRVEWTLNRVDGPGPVQVVETGAAGEPHVLFDSADGLPDRDPRAVGARAHFDWVFHAPGAYTLNFSVAGERPDGTSTVAYKEYRFFVGDLADLPPEQLWVDGLQEAYDVGAPVVLAARQASVSRFTDVRWWRSCDGDPERVATGAAYTFTAARADDGCRLSLTLHDDSGRELLRSAEVLVSVRSGHWGPRVIMSQGHADVLRVSLEGGALKVAVKDDSGDAAVERRPEDVLLHAKPQSRLVLTPELPPEFGFLGNVGDAVYLLPEVQEPELLWPGWDTDGVPRGALEGDELAWRLLSVEGPGAVQLFTSDLFGLPRIIFNSADGLPDASTMPADTHVHANWAFSRPGLYRLRFDLSGRPAGGGEAIGSGPLEYWFYAGDLADLPPYPEEEDEPEPEPTPTPMPPSAAAPPPVSSPAPAPAPVRPARPGLRLTSAKLRGRTLTLGTRLTVRSRVGVTVRRGTRVVARAKARSVPASQRTVRVRLDRRLAPGRYRVQVRADAAGGRQTRTITLRVR